MANFNRSFNFDPGSLGRNLATFDEKVHRYMNRSLDAATFKGELAMKARAPWTDDTGHARSSLWADNRKSNNRLSIIMGHGAEYGIYLEKSNDGKFQIIMPILLETARAYMRSLEQMFAQLNNPVPLVAITTGAGVRQGTSQHTIRKTRAIVRDERGRFVGQGGTKRTSRTRRT